MRHSSSLHHGITALVLGLLTMFGAVFAHPGMAEAQEMQNRVLWQLDFASSVSADQKSLIQSTMMNTLSRAKERHFVGDNILANKIKSEGLNFPECFTEGQPCSAGGAFVLDVHNVDAYAKAVFSYENDEWVIGLKLYRNLSASAVEINRMGPSLPDLLQTVVSSLFELEAGIEITSTLPGVQIYINQKLIGTTPMVMKLPAGEQSIMLKKDGYVSETWAFTAEKGKVYTKNVDLKPEETQLTVLTTVPDAEIWVDDQLWAKSNETQNILPGDHQIEVRSEGYHSFSQPYKVYPGTPQTIHVAPLPKSASPYDIRHNGIKKYRLSASVGYHFGTGVPGFKDSQAKSDSFIYTIDKIEESVTFHGISLALNYEAEYWGVTFFRLDIGGSGSFNFISNLYNPSEQISSGESEINWNAKDGVFVGFYPAQIRGHYTFWVMQAEATFGLGLSYMKLNAKASHGEHKVSSSFDSVAFSLNFNLGLKYFFSEETYVMLSYDLHQDFFVNAGTRHGMTIGVGMQIPAWMRSTDVPDLDSALDESDDDISEAVPTADAVMDSEIDELAQTAGKYADGSVNSDIKANTQAQEVMP